MESVARVLEHLGSANGRANELAWQMAEDAAQHLRAVVIVRTDYRHRRMIVVVDRRAFAQEFRLKDMLKSRPAFSPEASSIVGLMTSSTVPGLTVERITTT